ncbi:MAG: NAD-dependent epimerase/dehydratase family protein [Candidatus Gracilibacteria bacterium]|nr:NAD-dependent epimerase/dehydratase family protein [Candidatus Gracilibacteria bacterium]
MITILITGGTGFLGSNIIRKILENNIYNIVLLKRSTSNTENIKLLLKNESLKIYNIDQIDLNDIFKDNKIDIVFHTATCYGRNNEKITKIIESNLILPLKLLELCTEYRVSTFFNIDTTLPNGINYYVISKKQLLEYGKKFSDDTDLNFINIKLEHIFGPGDDESKFVGMIINKIKNNENYIDLTFGEQKRDFIYIDDVINMLLILINLNINININGFQEYEIGTGNTIEIKELVKKIKKILKSKIQLNFGKIEYRKGEQMISFAKLNKVFKNYKFESLDEGLIKTIKYFK